MLLPLYNQLRVRRRRRGTAPFLFLFFLHEELCLLHSHNRNNQMNEGTTTIARQHRSTRGGKGMRRGSRKTTSQPAAKHTFFFSFSMYVCVTSSFCAVGASSVQSISRVPGAWLNPPSCLQPVTENPLLAREAGERRERARER